MTYLIDGDPKRSQKAADFCLAVAVTVGFRRK